MISKAIINCQTKRAYSNKEEADKNGAWLWLEKQIEMESYKCNICENWHLSRKQEK
jgi:hypothetical protein